MGTRSRLRHDEAVGSAEPVSRRVSLRVAAVGAAVLASIAGAAVASAYDHGDPANAVASAFALGTFAAVGAIVALAVPDNRVGWFILAAATAWGVGVGLTEAGVHSVLTPGSSVPGGAYLAAIGPGLRGVGWVLSVLAAPAVFPDGHLPGRRWRWLAWVIAVSATCLFVGSLLDPHANETRLAHWQNPLAAPHVLSPAVGGLDLLGVLASATASAGVVSGLVVRWRRDGPQVRQQLLLLALAACPPVVVILLVIPTGGLPPWVFDLAVLPIPLAIAVAVLGYGVYDLRRATHRTLLWLTLSGIVIVVYAVVVLAAAALIPDRHSWWAPALGALVATLVLMPLHGTVQRGVTRVVYGRWHEPYEVLAGLGEQLEAAGDIDRLLDSTVEELTTGLGLRDVAVRGLDHTAIAGAAHSNGDSTSLRLTAYGSPAGWLEYRQDRPLSQVEQRLLLDLARQLGGALHARELRDELQQARKRLVVAREEERRRLRRDLHDGIGPALAGMTLKAETAQALLPDAESAASLQLAALSEDIRHAVLDVRRLVEGLRPPALDELGLVSACSQAVARLTAAADVESRVCAEQALPPLSAAVEVAAYRIVVEAVTNTVRHASATRCEVVLSSTPTMLQLTVSDDGAGIVSPAPDGNGLSIMRERAEEVGGRLTVAGTPVGTRVEACLPIGPPTAITDPQPAVRA
jgi:signal transduction histidine kinase